MDKVIDEIKTDRIEKFDKFFFYGAIATAIIAILKIFLNPTILTGGGKLLDYIISLLPIYMFFNFRQKTANRKGQFIKWTEDSIQFKSKDTECKIFISEIKDIKIGLDKIDLHLENGSTQTINIDDFTNYNDRLRIKENFGKLITTPNSKFAQNG
jgi:hypothetical protein